jgi:hypothetical protein
MAEAVKLEILQAQMEELRGRLETLKIGEGPRGQTLVAGSREKDFHTRIFYSITRY